jgi:hypothetical protein
MSEMKCTIRVKYKDEVVASYVTKESYQEIKDQIVENKFFVIFNVWSKGVKGVKPYTEYLVPLTSVVEIIND